MPFNGFVKALHMFCRNPKEVFNHTVDESNELVVNTSLMNIKSGYLGSKAICFVAWAVQAFTESRDPSATWSVCASITKAFDGLRNY